MRKRYYYNYQVQLAQNRIFAALNPFRFSSEYHDEDLDLIYYNYRYYNPTDGRWINRDPIQEQGGRNLYCMVRNNVVIHIDSLGFIQTSVNIKTTCKGTITGTLDSHVNFQAGGVVIDLTYTQQDSTSKNCCCSSWRWQQTVWSNAPLGGTTSPYNDPRPNDDDKPWYWTDKEYEAKKRADGTSFYDMPTRQFDPNKEIYWRAELVLKCLDKNKKVIKDLAFIYYGFHLHEDGTVTTNGPITQNGQ